MNASGCGVTVKEYGHHLAGDPAYADKAARISALTRDLSELLPSLLPALKHRVAANPKVTSGQLAFHPPCTLQHWQGLRPLSEQVMTQLGMTLQPFTESHLCCGSAGAYSVMQPEISKSLRDRKLANLNHAEPDVMMSSNIGCIGHLQSGTDTPVRHWIEVVDAALVTREIS